ncbi:helix-turn-helix domain-containing protein [Solwaraspora sp. WMMD792]|uniref:helix-turn-helix domain-containing protein n=1 Tax=Solwaraspora sp. WMMD792 TaxID=3016099 RepID=UPI0024172F6E|nr:helix-turn-helix domain-containing protein [Solwaraspora sp. WMMD792]MDG4771062.1 helix-turn-helix domain-containing protein [Solwaraspora sp. WMMD792]
MPATPPAERPTNAQIVSRYLAGAPIRRIAAELGVSYSYVHRRLHFSGVPIRGRGGRRPDPTVHADRTPESQDSVASADQDTLD